MALKLLMHNFDCSYLLLGSYFGFCLIVVTLGLFDSDSSLMLRPTHWLFVMHDTLLSVMLGHLRQVIHSDYSFIFD